MGIPVRFMFGAEEDSEGALLGGGRLVGRDPVTGRRHICTTGFVVTDGARTGVLTAAHCPDELTYREPGAKSVELTFLGQWGAVNQDVQINLVNDGAAEPRFFAGSGKYKSRAVQALRSRDSMRAGDFVCHRGERTGYSCSEIDMIDYAPPAPLCAGSCELSWVTVRGPSCGSGDSGGPVFIGTTALGILKGGNYTGRRRCNFYFYMALDYLPPGWALLRE